MQKIAGYLLWWFLYAISFIPKGAFYLLSDLFAFLMRCVFKYRTSTVAINLARSFPDLKYDQLQKITKEYYHYMCDIFMESVWAISASPKQLCKMVTVKNPQLMDDMCARHNKIIVMLGHRGNWELIGAFCGEKHNRKPESFANCRIMLGYKKANSAVSNFIFEKMRMHEYAKFGNKGHIVSSNSLLREIVKDKQKSIYVFIADQSPLLARTVTSFLNQKTLMFTGAEDIAAKLDLPVVFLDIDRIARGRYEISFSTITESAAKEPKRYITREYARLLEEGIMANKYNWLWSHKRWKRDLTPQEEQEFAELSIMARQISHDKILDNSTHSSE